MKFKSLIAVVLLCTACVPQAAKKGSSAITGTASLQTTGSSIVSMTVTPANQSIQVGSTVGYTATVTLSNGVSYPITAFVTWTSSNNTIASPTSLTSVELFTCSSAGTIQATAAFGAVISASTSLTCTTPPPPPTLTSISVSPVNPSCSVGQTQAFSALGTFSDNTTQDITATAAWTSTDTTIANPTGLSGGQEVYSCLKGGSVTVTATQSAISGTTTLTSNAVLTSVTVAPATASILVGQQQQFSATCNYSDGSTSNCAPNVPTWASSATGVATINSSGLATGLSAGTSNITAVIGSITSNTAVLTVSNPGPPPPTLTSITVTPANSTINTGTTLQYKATCVYSDNSTQDCTALATWNSTTPATATISSSGLATAVAVGTTTIQATYQSITGSTGLTVQAPVPTLVSIAVTPATPQVNVNSSIGFVATGTYSDASKKDVTLSATWTTSNQAVATLSAPTDPQVANCASAGTSTITATISAISGNTVLTCVNNNPPNLGNDAYCPGGVCNFGGSDHTATLPRNAGGYYTDPITYPGAGTVWTVTDNTSWTTAWTGAHCGDVIQQTAGFPLTNPPTPPAKSCALNPIVYRSSGFASLPAYGTRVTPCFSGVASLPGRPQYNCPPNPQNFMAQITTTTGKSALTLPANMKGVVWIGIEFTRASGTGLVSNVISMNAGGVDHIIFEHDWCHGDETGDETTTCLGLTATNFVAFLDNYANDFYCVAAVGSCTDAHVIGGGLNTTTGCADGQYKIVDNFLEGAAQSFLEGGGAAQCTPTDIEYRNNWEFKPQIWNPACTAASPCAIYENVGSGVVYNGGFQGGHPVLVKNHFELKNAAFVLYEGNRADNVWAGFSQAGESIILTPKNQAGPNGTNVCPLCQVHDVTIRYSNGGFAQQVMQIANSASDNGGYAQGGFNYSLHDLVYDNLNPVSCYLCQTSTAIFKAVEDAATPSNDILNHVYIDHITMVPAATAGFQSFSLMGIDGALSSTGNEMNNVTFTNLVAPLLHGAHNQAGGATDCSTNQTNAIGMLNNCYNPYTFGGNIFVDTLGQANNISWPGTNCLSQTSFGPVFTNYNNGINGIYTLQGPCKGTGTDGKDPGADIPTVNTRTQTATTFGTPPSGGPSVSPNWQLVPVPSSVTLIDNFDINPTNNHWFLTDRNGGVWKSTNQGGTWTQINTGLPTADCTQLGGSTNGVCGWTVQVNPATGDVILSLAGPTSGTGHFYRSSNEGASWAQIPEPVGYSISRGAFSGALMPPSTGGTMVFSGAGASGGTVMFSNNNGSTTTLSTENPKMGNAESTGLNGSVYGTGGENGGFQTSTNGGANFNVVWNCDPIGGPVVGPACGNTLDSTENYSEITDGNGNWVLSTRTGVWKLLGPPSAPTSLLHMYTSSTRDRVVFRDSFNSYYFGQTQNNTNATVTRSIDGGVTWKDWSGAIGPGLEAHKFVENPNDGKIYVVVENGKTNTGRLYSSPK